MKGATTEQQRLVEELGIQKSVLPEMSSDEVATIISGELESRRIRETRNALKKLLEHGLKCGDEVQQWFDSNSSRWGIVYKIDNETGKIGLRVAEKTFVMARAIDINISTVGKVAIGMTYVPGPLLKKIRAGKFGNEILDVLKSEIKPQTGLEACFLPSKLFETVGI